MFSSYFKIWNLLNSREKKYAVFLILLMIGFGVIEMLGIISIFPLVTVLSDPELIQKSTYLNNIYRYFNFNSTNNFLVFLTLIVFILTISRALLNGFLKHSILRYTQMRIHSFSTRLLNSYLKRPYIYFLGRHSADMGKSILSEVEAVIYGSLVPGLDLISRLIISCFVLFSIFLADPSVALISLLTLSTSYAFLYLLLRNYLLRKGKERIQANRNRFMIAQEALVGIKEIKVRNATDLYLQNFKKTTGIFHRLKINTSLAKLIPTLFIQIATNGGILIVILVLLTQVEDNYKEVIPLVSLYAFAGMRILPVIQGLFRNLTSLRSNKPALSILYEELIEDKKYIKKKEPVIFKKFDEILSIENISFRYPESKSPVIKDLSLNIKAKTSVAFVGSTGAGKSTVIDLILGLLDPEKGEIKIDGETLLKTNKKSWQKIIGYVPQTIFIADDTITKNIALGSKESEIDHERVEFVSELANLKEFIENELPLAYETKVGEAGVKLSGGQRQRLGIARALYLDPQVLIFDEATSALDNLTEKNIMRSINRLKNSITIIMIAHRLSTIKECDTIFHIANGKLKNQGSYSYLSKNDDLFKKMASELS